MPEDMSLTVFDPLKAINADILAKDDAQKFDIAVPEQVTALRSWVHRMRGQKGDLERCRLSAGETAKKYIKRINQIAKDCTAEIQERIDIRMKPLDEIEAEKKRKAEAIIAAEDLAKEKAEEEKQAKADAVEKELADLKAKVKADEDALLAKKAQEAQEAREKQIAADAAEKAKKDAEAQAQRDAEAKENQRLADEASLKAEEELQAKIEADRIADKKHQKKIEDVVAEGLTRITRSPILSDLILAEIIAGDIENLKIVY